MARKGNPNHYSRGYPGKKGGQFAPRGFSSAAAGYAHRTLDEVNEKYKDTPPPIEMVDMRRARSAMQIQEDIGGNFESAVYIAGAIESYTGHSYKQIRKAQRGEYSDSPTKMDARALEYFIKKAPQWKGGTCFRGVRNSARYDVSVGSVIDMGGMSSWTSDPKVIPNFTDEGGTVFVSDDMGLATSIKAYSKWEEEDEVLSSSENLYQVTGMEEREILFDDDSEPAMKRVRFVHVAAVQS